MTEVKTQYKLPFAEKVVVLSLVLYQILASYGTVSYWSYAVIFSYFASILIYCRVLAGHYKIRERVPKRLMQFFAFWLVVHVVTNLSGGLVFPQNILLIMFYYIAFWTAITKDNIHIAIKYYSVVAWICIGFFYIQELSVILTGTRIPGIIPYLPYALHALDYNEFMYRLAVSSRSGSFFSEPAYFAQFILPLLALKVFNSKNKKDYYLAAFVGVTLLLTQTGTGILASIGIIFVFFSSKYRNVNGKSFMSIVASAALLIIGIFLFSRTEMGASMIERQSEMSIENEGGSRSGFMRVYRGFMLFDEYDLIHKIIGNDNDREIARATMSSAISNEFGDNQDTFFNGASYCLLRTGVIGFLLLFGFLISIYKNNSPQGKAIILSFIILMFLEAVFFANNMLLFLIFSQRIKELNIQNQQ